MNKNEIKEFDEKEKLEKFLKTDIGHKYIIENGIIDIQKTESPDFLLITSANGTIALEVTQFIVSNNNLKFSQALTRYGNQLCKEAEERYNLKISILIDKYDKRKFSPIWKEHIDLAFNPGFTEVPPKDLFKKELQKILINNIEKLHREKLVQEWIQVKDDYFKVSIDSFMCPWTNKYNCLVNNAGKVLTNSIDELQECINKKNKKIKAYEKNASKCCLLIFVPSSLYGNYYSFNNTLFEHNFNSKFAQIFLYEEKTNKSFILNC